MPIDIHAIRIAKTFSGPAAEQGTGFLLHTRPANILVMPLHSLSVTDWRALGKRPSRPVEVLLQDTSGAEALAQVRYLPPATAPVFRHADSHRGSLNSPYGDVAFAQIVEADEDFALHPLKLCTSPLLPPQPVFVTGFPDGAHRARQGKLSMCDLDIVCRTAAKMCEVGASGSAVLHPTTGEVGGMGVAVDSYASQFYFVNSYQLQFHLNLARKQGCFAASPRELLRHLSAGPLPREKRAVAALKRGFVYSAYAAA